MGTWNHSAFGNDTACDWAFELASTSDLSTVEAAIDAVEANGIEDLDASTAECALAASESLACLRGRPESDAHCLQEVEEWIERARGCTTDDLAARALRAIDRIAGPASELRALWEESGSVSEWSASLGSLKERLLAVPLEVVPVDRVVRLIGRIAAMKFVVPGVPPMTPVGGLYSALLAAEALSDPAAVRDAIQRMWQPLAQLGKTSTLWDLAVRDAKLRAQEGALDEALQDTQAWRSDPVAANFEARMAGVCLAGRDLDRARHLYQVSSDAAPQDPIRRLDRALLEARLGDAQRARELLAMIPSEAITETVTPVIDFIRGILACRDSDPSAEGLLAEATARYAEKSLQGCAAWAMLSICGGWWALALAQAGRKENGAALVEALRPLLLQPHNRELVEALCRRGVLAAEAMSPAISTTPVPASRPRATFVAEDRGPFKTVCTRGVNAWMRWQAYRRDFESGSRLYPFLIGDEADLAGLLDMLTPPADGGRSALAQASAFDAAAWLAGRAPRGKANWPAEETPASRIVQSQYEVTTGRLKPWQFIGLVEVDAPWEVFARIGYGDWNDCAPAHVHAAVHRHWQKSFGAEPVAIGSDVVECRISAPPSVRKAALALAREHAAYCPDVVDQGWGDVGKLASALLNGERWYFWWD